MKITRTAVAFICVVGLVMALPTPRVRGQAAAPPLLHSLPVADDDPGSIIRRFVNPLLAGGPKAVTGFQSDQEHADSLGPVLEPDTPVFVHYARFSPNRANEQNLILRDGRIFVNFSYPHEPDEAPDLKIRPVDGGTRVPFIIRCQLYPRTEGQSDGSVEITFRFPVIFSPGVEVQSVLLNYRRANFRVIPGSTGDSFVLTIPVHRKELEQALRSPATPCSIYVNGSVSLNNYDTISTSRFAAAMPPLQDSTVAGIARLIASRDYRGEEERAELERLATGIAAGSDNLYEVIRRVNRYVGANIRYFRNSMTRTPLQVIQEGLGDCDDYTRVMITLLRALGIPAKSAVGHIYDFNHLGAHAWVEAGLPLKGGDLHWIICDPTLASAAQDPDYFIQFKNRIHIYPVTVKSRVLNLPVDDSMDVFLNWTGDEKLGAVSPHVFPSVIQRFYADFVTSFTDSVGVMRNSGLNLQREFLHSNGSPFVLSDRPVPPELPKITDMRDPDILYVAPDYQPAESKIHARFQIKLSREDDLLLDIGVIDDDFYLEAAGERRVADALVQAYRNICQHFFQGAEYRYITDISYLRDRHTDRLQKVSLRVGRYLLERNLKETVDAIRKAGLLKGPEYVLIDRLHTLSRGRNLYLMCDQSFTGHAGNGGILPMPF